MATLKQEQTEKQNLDLLDELNLYYGGEFIDYLLLKNGVKKDVGSVKMRKILQSIKIIRDKETSIKDFFPHIKK